MRVTFDGATNTVTGSKHIITTPNGKRLLLECGLFQGRGADTDARNRFFNFDPAAIDALILSHAHIDHSGNIPLLVKNGFKGKIYCTPATYELAEILLKDSAHIHENDIIYLNKRREKQGLPPLEPLYSSEDAEACLIHFETKNYNVWYPIFDDTKFMFTDAGHILGSAAVNLVFDDFGVKKSLCFTGDVGRSNNLLLKPPVPFPAPNYLITESTYGDRIHDAYKKHVLSVEANY
jgi:metallo-beta-lactamase family protein